VNRKTLAALAHSLIPIVCVGETLAEYDSGLTAEVVDRQVKQGLDGLQLNNGNALVIAYEPVWAIGTGKAATADGANVIVHDVIRPALAQTLGETLAQEIRVLYGGSVKGDNAGEFFAMPDIDGALVGGASLKAGEFVKIAQAAV
jgi:triosephosphate isomerase